MFISFTYYQDLYIKITKKEKEKIKIERPKYVEDQTIQDRRHFTVSVLQLLSQ